MSYAGSSGSGASLNSTLAGATQGGGSLYVQPSTLELKEDYVNLTYSDGSGGYTLGLGVGPVAPPAGPFIGGYQNLEGTLHVEDPGGSALPTVYVQSHYQAPRVQLQNAVNYNPGVVGALFTTGVNSTSAELIPGTKIDDVCFAYAGPVTAGKYYRFGDVSYGGGTFGPLLSIGVYATNPYVGVNQDNPIATLHAGCGTNVPIISNPVVYASRFGDTTVSVRDSTNKIELGLGVVSGNAFVGTATGNDLRLNVNNTARGILTQTGNFFIGSTSPASYNPEVTVLGLTGFPSAAISIAGNQTSDGSVGQLAWYNDAAGVGTRVASVQVKRSSSNNNSTMTLSTMNSGSILPSLFIGATQWVGILNQSPLAALDVTGNIRFSGALTPNGNAGTPGQYLSSGGPTGTPTWVNSAQGAGGLTTQIQFNSSGYLNGTTNFEWDNTYNRLLLSGGIFLGTTTDYAEPGSSSFEILPTTGNGTFTIGGSVAFANHVTSNLKGTSSVWLWSDTSNNVVSNAASVLSMIPTLNNTILSAIPDNFEAISMVPSLDAGTNISDIHKNLGIDAVAIRPSFGKTPPGLTHSALHVYKFYDGSGKAVANVGVNVDMTDCVNANSQIYAATFIGGNVGVGTKAPKATLTATGSVAFTATRVINSVTIGSTYSTILCDASMTAGGFTVTLPATPSSEAPGRRLWFKKVDSSVNGITISSATANIDGDSAIVLGVPYQTVDLVTDGVSNWFVL